MTRAWPAARPEPPRAQGWLRPARPLSPVVSSPVALGLGWVVAHHSGSGWVQVLGELVFGTLLVGILWPAGALARAKVALVRAPVDATAGTAVELHLVASSRVRVRPVVPPGPPAPLSSGGGAPVLLLPARRGVHDRLVLDVATAAPFGIQWWTRRVVLDLPAPLHVAPQCLAAGAVPDTDDGGGPATGGRAAVKGEPRGARPYVRGDRRQLVHWRLSAHAGDLLVRESDATGRSPVRLVVELPPDEAAGEEAAGRALGAVVAALDGGSEIILVTREASGWREAPVTSAREAGRRLAGTVSG